MTTERLTPNLGFNIMTADSTSIAKPAKPHKDVPLTPNKAIGYWVKKIRAMFIDLDPVMRSARCTPRIPTKGGSSSVQVLHPYFGRTQKAHIKRSSRSTAHIPKEGIEAKGSNGTQIDPVEMYNGRMASMSTIPKKLKTKRRWCPLNGLGLPCEAEPQLHCVARLSLAMSSPLVPAHQLVSHLGPKSPQLKGDDGVTRQFNRLPAPQLLSVHFGC